MLLSTFFHEEPQIQYDFDILSQPLSSAHCVVKVPRLPLLAQSRRNRRLGECPLTTLTSYGSVAPARQAEIIRSMWQAKALAPATDLASLIVLLQRAGVVEPGVNG